MAGTYKLISGSAAEAFHLSRKKIRLYGGGFANGKTTALVADALRIARDYPGASMMLGRASYPKLNSTLRREFFKWCPSSWIKSFNKQDNTCVLRNDTIIDFRYIEQRGGADGESTSNLLSANYDYVGIDQIEDPEITEHDFEQLLGRLRGNAAYAGDDDTMPLTGPRYMSLTCNPTLGWVYKRLVKPLHDLRAGRFNPDLICEVDNDGRPVLVNGQPIPLVEVFEASTYENAQNLEADYIKTLEATYRGKMRDRYLLGKWVAFDGVVYDEFDEAVHIIAHDTLVRHIADLRQQGYRLTIIEGYDLGITAPSCYLLALVDALGITYVVGGFYERDMGIGAQADAINTLRAELAGPELIVRDTEPEVLADPAIFRRTNAGQVTGQTTAAMFVDNGIRMRRGNNAILNGIIKVKQHLHIRETVLNPFTHGYGCPSLFVSDKLTWFHDEMSTWRWKRGKDDTAIDMPVDMNNHAMDALKYMLTDTPQPGTLVTTTRRPLPPKLRMWNEMEAATVDNRSHRYMR
jgi:hypothetical protein